MQFGWCGPVEKAGEMRDAGADYIEVQVVPLNLEDAAAFARARAAIEDLPLPAPAFSYLFPLDVRVVGPAVDEARLRRYLERVAEVMTLAKARVLVVGSGWTRNVPEGGDRARTEDQFLTAVGWCADALKGSGATVVIEPLNRKESNLVNSVADAVRLARRLDRPDVRGHADFYHIDEENEPLETLETHAAWIGHVHLADSDRLNPGTGRYDYDRFFGHLKAGGYKGLMSSECSLAGEPVAAMRSSLAFLRAKWAAA